MQQSLFAYDRPEQAARLAPMLKKLAEAGYLFRYQLVEVRRLARLDLQARPVYDSRQVLAPEIRGRVPG